MKILLDEQLAGLQPFLQSLGYDVLTVHEENLQGAKDIEVVFHAKNHNLVLITQDTGQAQMSKLHNVKHIWLNQALLAETIHRKLQTIEE